MIVDKTEKVWYISGMIAQYGWTAIKAFFYAGAWLIAGCLLAMSAVPSLRWDDMFRWAIPIAPFWMLMSGVYALIIVLAAVGRKGR